MGKSHKKSVEEYQESEYDIERRIARQKANDFTLAMDDDFDEDDLEDICSAEDLIDPDDLDEDSSLFEDDDDDDDFDDEEEANVGEGVE